MNAMTNILMAGNVQHMPMVPRSIIQLGAALLLTLLLAFTYRKLHSDREDCHVLMHSMIYIGVIMTGAMMLIASNIVVAIGLFGAVSIVRFRTAVSNPIDMSYIFLCVVIGISCGLGFVLHAVVMALFVGTVMVLFHKLKFGMNPPTMITCIFTITAKRSFFTPDVMERLNSIFTSNARMLEVKTKKKKITLKYTQQVMDINDVHRIEQLLEPLHHEDPSMELAIARQ